VRKTLTAIISTAAAVTLVTGLAAAPSLATTTPSTWTVSPGGKWTGRGSGDFVLADRSTHKKLVCTQTHAAGEFKSGSGLPGTDIGTVSALTFASCKLPNGASFTVTAGDLPWHLNAVKYSSSVKGGTTTGTVTGIHAKISASSCSATIDGTSATAGDGSTLMHYHNSLKKLKVEAQSSTLHAYDVTGCTGALETGNAVTVTFGYVLSPAQKITSP
jgi:hypothetical protein